MSLENKNPVADIENIEHDDSSDFKKGVLYGKTTSGTYVPVKLNDNGSFK